MMQPCALPTATVVDFRMRIHTRENGRTDEKYRPAVFAYRGGG